MKKRDQYVFDSISDYHAVMNLKKPTNPLISVVRLEDISPEASMGLEKIVFNFHTIFEKNFDGRIRYGQKYYDFIDSIRYSNPNFYIIFNHKKLIHKICFLISVQNLISFF